jgi:homoserine kinase
VPAARAAAFVVAQTDALASGLGSSGASSAAGAFAANEILGRPFSTRDVVLSAIEGECAASGTPHADNVAPSVMGGFILGAQRRTF